MSRRPSPVSPGSPPAPPLDALLDVDAVAKLLGVRPRTVRQMAMRGELSYLRLGGRLLRFQPADIARFLAGARVEATTTR